MYGFSFSCKGSRNKGLQRDTKKAERSLWFNNQGCCPTTCVPGNLGYLAPSSFSKLYVSIVSMISTTTTIRHKSLKIQIDKIFLEILPYLWFLVLIDYLKSFLCRVWKWLCSNVSIEIYSIKLLYFLMYVVLSWKNSVISQKKLFWN